MTVEEMAEKIFNFISIRRFGVSFVELSREIGEEAEGDNSMEISDLNICFWMNMSESFVKSMLSLREKIDPVPCSVLVYLADGRIPRLPVAKSARKYNDLHWAPVTWKIKDWHEKKGTK